MRRKSHRTHYIFHITEHLLGVFGVLVIATGVALATPSLGSATLVLDSVRPTEPTLHVASVLSSGISLYWDGATDNVGVVGYRLFKNGALLVSQTMPTFTDTSDLRPGALFEYTIAAVDASGNSSAISHPTFAIVPADADNISDEEKEIYFSVTPAPVTDCASGNPMHEVFFVVSNPEGGDFLLTPSIDAVAEKTVAWGRQLLPNGLYTWKGIPRTGYTVLGVASGQIELTGDCAFGSTGTSLLGSPSESVESIHSKENTSSSQKPTLRFFVDSVPVSDTERNFKGENVELRVAVSQAKKVNYYAMKEGVSSPVSLGVGVYDDLLSMKGNDVWIMTWQTRNITPGTYRVFARVLLLSGETSESLPASVIITAQEGILRSTSQVEDIEDNEIGGALLLKKKEVQVLTVTDATLCSDARSCKAYCTQGSSESDQCFAYAQELVSGTSSVGLASLADGVSLERITKLLSDLSRRPKDLPEYVAQASDFVVFCRDASHAEVCRRILERSDFVSSHVLENSITVVKREQEAVNRILAERVGVRPFIDTDGDHISDYDEVNLFGTNPDEDDSDADGFLDSEELINHTNPLGSLQEENTPFVSAVPSDHILSISEEVRMEDPRLLPGFTSSLLSIDDVSLSQDSESADKNLLAFSGTAPKNSYVTLFVFSDPISVSMKTNASGTWSYVMKRDLAPGAHEAIVTISNAEGKVLARSLSLNFAKDGSAITVAPIASVTSESSSSSAKVFAIVALLLAGLGIVFSVVGILFHRQKEHHITRAVS